MPILDAQSLKLKENNNSGVELCTQLEMTRFNEPAD